MKRVRTHALVLINWKGVFYERYLLDDRVTALEGDNGAGKTTVMIAAYVALLPDMTRLRFTNVGESDASGGDRGIWGRLGNPHRPSYAALAFDIDGEHVVAGVHLERKAEPSVELTPFLVSDLPKAGHLQDVFLLRSGSQDLVPELTDLRENVAALGGRIQVFKTAKEYFAALFERGITPLRLVVDEERTRFNDMHRTSMTGGISRALTAEFRSFLLKEESGLADTLVRMRSNLEACRRTRIEVKEARDLEKEISAVYEAGHDMFSASLLATRERALELRRRVDLARDERDRILRDRDEVASEHRDRVERKTEAERRLAEARERYDTTRAFLEGVTKAHSLASRLADYDTELDQLRTQLRQADNELRRSNQLKTLRDAEKSRAETAHRTAAEGLADVQSGLQELHRRAGAYRTVTQRLQDAGPAVGKAEAKDDGLELHEEKAQLALTAMDHKRGDLSRSIADADLHRSRTADALSALALILNQNVDANEAYASAQQALRHLVHLEALSAREGAFLEDLNKSRAQSERQQATRLAAEALAQPQQPLKSSLDVRAALHEGESEVRALEDKVRSYEAGADGEARRELELKSEYQSLEVRQIRWRELDTVAKQLEESLGAGLRTTGELEAARQLLDEARDELQGNLEALEKECADTRNRARLLEQTGGVFHRDLLAIRDALGGELLAGQFDDLEPARAARMQALLGPLTEAIVVENAHRAAEALNGGERDLETVWLIQGGALHDLASSEKKSGSDKHVIVERDGVARVTRVPQKPSLGRKARERLIKELHSKADNDQRRVLGIKEQLTVIDVQRSQTALLTRGLSILESGDSTQELGRIAHELQRASEQARTHRANAADTRGRVTRVAERVTRLRDLYGQAFLLDDADLVVRVKELEECHRSAVQARSELVRVSNARQTLVEHSDALRRLPLSDSEIETTRDKLRRLDSHRQILWLALDALRYVIAHRDELQWADAADQLSTKQQLIPALKEQCDKAASALKEAIETAQVADRSWEQARNARRTVDDKVGAIEARRTELARELEETGVEDSSTTAVVNAQANVRTLEASVIQLDSEQRGLEVAIAQLAERLDSRNKALTDAEDHLSKEEREWKPANELWERLRARCEAENLLTSSISQRLLETGIASVRLRSDARSSAGILEERLSRASGANEALNAVRSWLSGQDQSEGPDILDVWASVRDWLSMRVPAQIAELLDPFESLERLREHLIALDTRLESQELELRGASEDVARGIDVHIRSAHRQVRLLNRELEGVHFGTIRGMRIRLDRDSQMETILSALREGTAQELLFSPNMPVEEALDQLFIRYGGRGSTVGQKLLDYREYLDIAVEITRQGSAEWERVNPSRLSTGEAIGIGTALMMVVLTAWEQSANLFRARRSLGTLRFLFLDEANRLSQDNLGVLFELCLALNLQLLIASPEVANVPGCTTYRLVRRETTDGGERVLVSGRRAIKSASDVGA